MRAADVDFLTIGQYLQPTPKHAAGRALRARRPSSRNYERIARAKGFLMVSASPLTRSSLSRRRRFRAPARGARRPARGLTGPLASCRHAERAASSAIRPSSCSTWWPTSSAIRNSCPGATAARVRQREERDVEIAELAIGFGPFHEKFVSRVDADARCAGRSAHRVRPGSKARSASWQAIGRSSPIPTAALIDSSQLEFEFRSMLLQQTVRLLFAEAVRRMVARLRGARQAALRQA